MAGKLQKPDLVIALQGGSSYPLGDLAAALAGVLGEHGFSQVLIDEPEGEDLVWTEGWDGFVSDDVVVIRRG